MAPILDQITFEFLALLKIFLLLILVLNTNFLICDVALQNYWSWMHSFFLRTTKKLSPLHYNNRNSEKNVMNEQLNTHRKWMINCNQINYFMPEKNMKEKMYKMKERFLINGMCDEEIRRCVAKPDVQSSRNLSLETKEGCWIAVQCLPSRMAVNAGRFPCKWRKESKQWIPKIEHVSNVKKMGTRRTFIKIRMRVEISGTHYEERYFLKCNIHRTL